MMRILTRLRSEPWAIRSEEMETILDIASRQNTETPESIATRLGRPLENTYSVEYRDGVAIIPISGPLFRYANLFTMVSGATSYAMLGTDIQAALDDKKVKAILLNVDSPGGEVSGCAELADLIFNARGVKPIWAYVGGMAASAGYWLASSAERIIVAETSLTGSIGAMLQVYDRSARDARDGIKTYTIISTQSPLKNIGPETDVGMAKMQAMVDSLSQVFVDKVARNRDVSVEYVLEHFGQGSVLIGQDAVDAGMVDGLGSFESVISELQGDFPGINAIHFAASSGSNKEPTMSNEKKPVVSEATATTEAVTAESVAKNNPEVAAALRAEGAATAAASAPKPAASAAADAAPADAAAQERARVKGIVECAEAKGREKQANHLAFNTSMSVADAVALLAVSAQDAPAKTENALARAMENVQNPPVGADAAAVEGDEAEMQAFLDTAKALGKSPSTKA